MFDTDPLDDRNEAADTLQAEWHKSAPGGGLADVVIGVALAAAVFCAGLAVYLPV